LEIINKIQSFFESITEKQFFRYTIIVLGCILVLACGIIYYYYRSITSLEEQLEDTNSMRQEVKKILDKASHVQQQRAEVDKIIKENEDFLIRDYFNKLLEEMHLIDNLGGELQIETVDREDNYREVSLRSEFVGLTMKELVELLQAIEQKKIIYTKSLDIIKSKKIAHTIDVNLTIATLQPKTVAG
jgi:hypothetical protein